MIVLGKLGFTHDQVRREIARTYVTWPSFPQHFCKGLEMAWAPDAKPAGYTMAYQLTGGCHVFQVLSLSSGTMTTERLNDDPRLLVPVIEISSVFFGVELQHVFCLS